MSEIYIFKDGQFTDAVKSGFSISDYVADNTNNFNNLSSYFGTSKGLVTRTRSNDGTMIISDNCIRKSASDNAGITLNYAIPVNRISNVTKIVIEYKVTNNSSSSGRYDRVYFGMRKIDGSQLTGGSATLLYPYATDFTEAEYELTLDYCDYVVLSLADHPNALYKSIKILTTVTSNGGGSTHIAKVTGQLKDLSSNLSDILMVSGGGGGGLLVSDTDYSGKDAGGISGSGDNSADQSTGNAFGQGESGTNVSGGGSGLYGGYKGTSSKGGGAGSGYIGNSLVSNKKMVGYNVPTSSAESTKTESVNEVSASAVSGKPKSGNGFARIKFLSEPTWDVVGTWIDGRRMYKIDVDFHNPNGFDRNSELNTGLPKCRCIFLGESSYIIANSQGDNKLPFPYIHPNRDLVVGYLWNYDASLNKTFLSLRRRPSSNNATPVYDVYATIYFVL